MFSYHRMCSLTIVKLCPHAHISALLKSPAGSSRENPHGPSLAGVSCHPHRVMQRLSPDRGRTCHGHCFLIKSLSPSLSLSLSKVSLSLSFPFKAPGRWFMIPMYVTRDPEHDTSWQLYPTPTCSYAHTPASYIFLYYITYHTIYYLSPCLLTEQLTD